MLFLRQADVLGWLEVGFETGMLSTSKNGSRLAKPMIEYVQAFALFALFAFAVYVEKSTRSNLEEWPEKTEAVTNQIERMTEVLDDIANLLNEGLHAIAGSGPAQTASNPMEMILSTLMASMTSKRNHGPQENERTIHEIHPTQTLETEDEPQ